MPARRRHLTVAAALCLVALLGLAGPTRVDAAQAGAGAAPAPSRAGPLSALNAGMTPLALDIALTPHFDAQGVSTRFDAQARLSLTATAALQSIELHALDLQVLSASIDGVPLPAPTVLAERQRLRFKLARPLTKGRHELQINYRGLIGLAPQGLFRIGLPERDRQPHAGLGQAQVLATQMEPADARRLAPMIDEPGVRIPYTLSVTVPAGLTVVANTELVEQVPAPAPAGSTVVAPGRATPSPTPLVTWRFAPTPPMASYLIGLFIGEFEHVEDLSARPALRVYTVPGKREQGRMALRLARQLVSHYEDYFGQPYPLSKLDQIALPGGFEGGMENWGAIAYHESALLFDAASSPPDRYRRVWNLVSHEVAHQWFGNLVTMAWWDDLWLNEAFASWMAARATEALTGDASVWSDTQRPLQATMGSDALATALPVIRPVDDDRAAFSSFDDITYHKGMAFVRQLETRLGAEPFRDGLRRYMATHRLGTTRAADLWQALEAASARPVASLADAWLRRPGLPEVTLRARCAGGQTRIDLTQRRFLLDPPRQAGRDSAMLWPLTLELARFDPQGERLDHHTVDLDQAQATLTLPGCGGALKLKPGGAGFYRAAYGQPLRDANPPTAAANGPRAAARPPGLTARRPDVTPAAVPPDEIDLLGALQAVLHRLPEADRVDLIGDAWAQVQAGQLSAPRWVELVHALGDDSSPAVWGTVITGLRSLDLALEQAGHPALAAWRARAGALLRPLLHTARAAADSGDDTEPEAQRRRARRAAQVHELALAELGRIDDVHSVDQAQAEWLGSPGGGGTATAASAGAGQQRLSPALLGLIGRHADAAQFEQLRRQAGSEPDAQRRSLLWSSLAGNRRLDLARQAMALARSDEVPVADAPWLLVSAADAGHLSAAWTELRQHQAELMDPLAEWDRAELAPALLASATDPRLAEALLAWTSGRIGPRAMPAARKAAGIIRVHAALARRAVPDLARWLGH